MIPAGALACKLKNKIGIILHIQLRKAFHFTFRAALGVLICESIAPDAKKVIASVKSADDSVTPGFATSEILSMLYNDNMRTQNITGQSTEQKVRNFLRSLGMEAEKPKRDIGVDLEVWHSAKHDRYVNVQIKGRGKVQTNRKYRWFQIRTTEKQRTDAKTAGLPVSEAWRKKVNLCDFFILVSERHDEYWVFPKDVVCEIVEINSKKYKNRKDNEDGLQAEINLDIADADGAKLTERYAEYLNNFQIIRNVLLRK